jgi:hypothetical protein
VPAGAYEDVDALVEAVEDVDGVVVMPAKSTNLSSCAWARARDGTYQQSQHQHTRYSYLPGSKQELQ